MHNWKKRSSYESLLRATGAQMAWEFLRRNSDYRSAYAQHQDHNDAPVTLERFGLKKFIDPSTSSQCENFSADAFRRSKVTIYLAPAVGGPWPQEVAIQMESMAEVAITFNATRRLKRQLSRANELLTTHREALKSKYKMQPTLPKKQNNRFLVRLLRILDADESGASNQEILKVFSKKTPYSPQNLNHNRKRAQLMMTSGYRDLARR